MMLSVAVRLSDGPAGQSPLGAARRVLAGALDAWPVAPDHCAMTQRDFAQPAVADAFAAFPADARDGLLILRALIWEVADDLPQIGAVSEELRWGQPAYLTPKTKAGSTLRLGLCKGDIAIFAHCQTTIINDYASQFPGLDRIEGNRAVRFKDTNSIDLSRIALLIRAGLTYHL